MMTNAISRGELWMTLLAPNVKRVEGLCPSVQAADGELNGEAVRFVAVVPDAHNHFPRAAKGEVGLLEGWTLAKGASKAKRLAVSVPSHCALLADPAQKLAAAFESVTLSRPRCAYLSGSTGRVLWQPEKITDDLAMNMARTVRWQEAVISANERDARLAIEMPPGGVLTCLTRQAAWEGESISLERSGVDVAVHLAGRLRA